MLALFHVPTRVFADESCRAAHHVAPESLDPICAPMIPFTLRDMSQFSTFDIVQVSPNVNAFPCSHQWLAFHPLHVSAYALVHGAKDRNVRYHVRS